MMRSLSLMLLLLLMMRMVTTVTGTHPHEEEEEELFSQNSYKVAERPTEDRQGDRWTDS